MSYEFQTRVSGIPAICRVLHYQPPEQRRMINSASLEPQEEEEFEFTICDRRGREAPWLWDKLNESDAIRFHAEFLRQLDIDAEP